MSQTVKWLPKPEKHDFQAAEDYLSLIMPVKQAAGWRRKLAAARNDVTHVCASYWIDENTDIPCILV